MRSSPQTDFGTIPSRSEPAHDRARIIRAGNRQMPAGRGSDEVRFCAADRSGQQDRLASSGVFGSGAAEQEER